jgi:hypothetical protein
LDKVSDTWHGFNGTSTDAGVFAAERMEIVTLLAQHPDAGDLIIGSGGARNSGFRDEAKVRVAVIA